MTTARDATGPLQLELRRVSRRLEPPQRNANATWSERSSLEVVLRGAGGATGLGEAAPLPGYSVDDLDRAEAALERLGPAELGALPGDDDPCALIAAAAQLVPAQLPSAQFALETALLDRAARRAGVPLWQLLAVLVGPSERSTERSSAVSTGPERARAGGIALCALLPSNDPGAASELARRHLAQGVAVFKLKVGPDRLRPEQDATFARLRAELGHTIRLRADANGSLSRAGLASTLAHLGAHGVEFLEEPLAGADPDLLRDSPCPLALDESLQRIVPASLARWLALPALRALVLKPTTLGGLGACVRLARDARASGCDAVVSHAFEGPIGWAACAHLALALNEPRAAGLWPLAHQAAASLRIENGWLRLSAQPGLGGPA